MEGTRHQVLFCLGPKNGALTGVKLDLLASKGMAALGSLLGESHGHTNRTSSTTRVVC